MAIIATSSDFPTTGATARPSLIQRFFAALVDARMRKAEAIVRRARRTVHDRALINAGLGAPDSGARHSGS